MKQKRKLFFAHYRIQQLDFNYRSTALVPNHEITTATTQVAKFITLCKQIQSVSTTPLDEQQLLQLTTYHRRHR